MLYLTLQKNTNIKSDRTNKEKKEKRPCHKGVDNNTILTMDIIIKVFVELELNDYEKMLIESRLCLSKRKQGIPEYCQIWTVVLLVSQSRLFFSLILYLIRA